MKKTTNLLFLAVVMMISSFVTAQSETQLPDSTSIELKNKLKRVPYVIEGELDVLAVAYIKFNGSRKIVDINVRCSNPSIGNFIKTRLIHEKVESNVNTKKVYALPIRIKPSK
jgi:hypothetical protein